MQANKTHDEGYNIIQLHTHVFSDHFLGAGISLLLLFVATYDFFITNISLSVPSTQRTIIESDPLQMICHISIGTGAKSTAIFSVYYTWHNVRLLLL